jgi:acyl-CoA thioesterase
MSMGALIARLQPDGTDRLVLSDADGWMQGRTMYGGASALIAYAAARRQRPDLPPLRGAQIGFVAPVGSDVEARVGVLREGRSVAQVTTDLFCEGAPVLRALWLFGAARPTNGGVPAMRADETIPVEEAAPVTATGDAPQFIHNFEMRRAEPRGGARPGAIRRWVRLRDRKGLDPIAELVGIGDALPPGAVRAMERRGPISSINWSLTLLGDAPRTRDGWWLLETASNHMADGFSSETLRMWNADGVEVMRGLQSVAIFG